MQPYSLILTTKKFHTINIIETSGFAKLTHTVACTQFTIRCILVALNFDGLVYEIILVPLILAFLLAKLIK